MGRVLPRRDAETGGPPPPVVATVGFSLTQDTRKKDAALPAPPQAGYVSELAVSGACRRRGYAKLMLRAAEQLTAQVRCTALRCRPSLPPGGDAPRTGDNVTRPPQCNARRAPKPRVAL